MQAFAAPQTKDGFSGFFDIGLLGIKTNDALIVAEDSEEIHSLGESPDYSRTAKGIALFEVKYKKGNRVLHAGTPMSEGEPALLFGTTVYKGDSVIDLSIIFDIFKEEWKNPYVSDRDGTKSETIGMRLKMDGIAGSRFGTEVRILGNDIKNDDIGNMHSSMARDGATFDIRANYKIPAGRGFLLPSIGYKKEYRLGEAVSGNEIGTGLRFVRMFSSGMLMADAGVSYMKYDGKDVIFDKVRKESKAGAFLLYKHNLPKDFHISLMGGGTQRFTNIDFYDAKTLFAGVTFGLDF